MSLSVVGTRTFDDYELLKKTLSNLDIIDSVKEIISGGAKGADKLAEVYAEENNLNIRIFLPDWEKHGRAAGPIRNRQIIQNSDYIVAFWDGKSPGTKSSINIAKELNKPISIIYYNSLKVDDAC
jgi:predicted Rossmann fold nucleotide-binding protein DprA/Smf involved in DNA uptake